LGALDAGILGKRVHIHPLFDALLDAAPELANGQRVEVAFQQITSTTQAATQPSSDLT
jgi:hypothetical protein